MATIEQLKELAEEIRTNTAAASNTNEKVGSTLKGITEHLEDVEENTDAIPQLQNAVAGNTADISNLQGRMTTAEDAVAKSDGIISLLELRDFDVANFAIQETGKLGTSTNYGHGVLPVREGDVFVIQNNQEALDTVRYVFATSDYRTAGGTIPRVGDIGVVNHQSFSFITIPAGCTHLLWNSVNYSSKIFGFSDDAYFGSGEAVKDISFENWGVSGNTIVNASTVKTILNNITTEVVGFEVAYGSIQATGILGTGTNYGHGVLAVEPGKIFCLTNNQNTDTIRYAFATTDALVQGSDIPRVGGVGVVLRGETSVIIIPEGCTHLVWNSTIGYNSMLNTWQVETDVRKTDIPVSSRAVVNTIESEQEKYTESVTVPLSGWVNGTFSGSVGNPASWGTSNKAKHSGKIDISSRDKLVRCKTYYRVSDYQQDVIFVDFANIVISTYSYPRVGLEVGDAMEYTIPIPDGAVGMYVVTSNENGSTPAMAQCDFVYNSNELISEVQRETSAISLTGAGDAIALSRPFTNYICGHKYRMWVKTPDLPKNEVTITSSSYNWLSVSSSFGGVKTYLVRESITSTKEKLDDYYDFTVPDDSDFIEFSTRANAGLEQTLIIEDITNKESVEMWTKINTNDIATRTRTITEEGAWGATTYSHIVVPVREGDVIRVTPMASYARIAYLAQRGVSTDDGPYFAPGQTGRLTIENQTVITIPEGCHYLYCYAGATAGDVRDYIPDLRILDNGDPTNPVSLNVISQALSDEDKQQVQKNIGVDSLLDEISKSVDWELSPMIEYHGLKINQRQKFLTSNTHFCVFSLPVTRGELLKIAFVETESTTTTKTTFFGFSELEPVADGVLSQYGTITGDTIIRVPHDGYFCCNTFEDSIYKVKVYKIRNVSIPNTMAPRSVKIDTFTSGCYLQAVDNPNGTRLGELITTYGTAGAVVTPNWKVSDFIDISKYTYIAVPAWYLSTQSLHAYQDKAVAGAVWYDVNKDIIGCAAFTGCFITAGSESTMVALKVPSEAKYIRTSFYNSEGSATSNNTIHVYEKNAFTNKNDIDVGNDSIFSLNPDSDVLQKMMLLNKHHNIGNQAEDSSKPVVLAHISDIHGAKTQYTRFIDFAEYWKGKGYVDDFIDTGDVVNGNYGSGIAWRDSLDGTKKIITIVGNHDTCGTDSEKTAAETEIGRSLTQAEFWQLHSNDSVLARNRIDTYNRYLIGPESQSPYVDNWGVIQPADASENGYCYFYKDYVVNSDLGYDGCKCLRLIGLDCMGYDSVQDSWLQDVLAEAHSLRYHVCILTHMPGAVMVGLPCNYTSLFGSGDSVSTQTSHYSPYLDHLPQTVDAFQRTGGIFVGYFIGHWHRDMVNVLRDYPMQLAFAVDSGGKNNNRDSTKIVGSKSYDSFQFIGINTVDKMVRLVKVGADIDYYMRKKGTLCVSYETELVDGVYKAKGIIGEGL